MWQISAASNHIRLADQETIALMFKRAKIVKIERKRSGFTEAVVDLETETARAVNYDDLLGEVQVGDEVIVNTTAVDLGLGSGGVHFVLWNLNKSKYSPASSGHIMKLRYTPLQIACLAAEEQQSQHHSLIKDKREIGGMPVIVGELHSQLPAAVVTIKKLRPETRIAYLMTDAGALPIKFSHLVAALKEKNLLDVTITLGNAFGGDLEAVNVYSALIVAQAAAGADIAVVAMGPGVTGTESALGFSGIEQGMVINAVSALKGKAIAIPRLSFRDPRKRHYGVSHHTLTALSLAALAPALVVVPQMDEKKMALVQSRLHEHGIYAKHQVEVIENEITLEALKDYGIGVTTMGREVREEPEFFQAAGAAGIVAVRMLEEKK